MQEFGAANIANMSISGEEEEYEFEVGCDCGDFGADVSFGDEYDNSDFGLFGIKIKFPKLRIKPPAFVTDALKAAGKATTTVTSGIASGAGSLGSLAGKIPVVGTPISAVYNAAVTTPFKVVNGVVSGKRLDKVAYETLQNAVKNAQTLAPYAQAVVSTVPGVGTGAAGVIGAANALSKGKPISAAIVEGVKGSLPGGPVATAAFDVAYAGMQGKPVSEVALNAIPLPPEQKKLVISGIKAASDIANGKRADEAIVKRALDIAPPQVRQAMQVGMAVAQGEKLQKIAAKAAPSVLGKVNVEGRALVQNNPVLRAGFRTLKGASQKSGFVTGTGVMSHKLTPTSFEYIRKALSPAQKKGFDVAVATRVGQTNVTAPRGNAQQQFGYLVAKGASHASPETKERIIKAVTKSPKARQGVVRAIRKEKNLSVWEKIRKFLGLR